MTCCDISAKPVLIFWLISLFLTLASLLVYYAGFDYAEFGSLTFSKYQSISIKLKETVDPLVVSVYASDDIIAAIIPFFKPIGTLVYCRYFDENNNEIKPSTVSNVYPLFVVYCEKRNAVGLTVSDLPDTEILPIFITRIATQKGEKHKLTHCGAPVFGKEPKWLQITEMIEHYKLQGVTKFVFYVRELSFYDHVVLEYYKRKGDVEIVKMPSVFIDVISQQLLAVADCHLRSELTSEWSIFSDIDERLMMTDENITLASFIGNLKDDKIGSILFSQRWILKREQFPEKFVNDEMAIRSMPTQAWHETTAPLRNCTGQRSCWGKHIVNNAKVDRMLVHDVGEFKPGFHQMNLDPSIGYIRHYRDTRMENWEEKHLKQMQNFGPISNTSYPHVLSEKLVENVLKVLNEVYK